MTVGATSTTPRWTTRQRATLGTALLIGIAIRVVLLPTDGFRPAKKGPLSEEVLLGLMWMQKTVLSFTPAILGNSAGLLPKKLRVLVARHPIPKSSNPAFSI